MVRVYYNGNTVRKDKGGGVPLPLHRSIQNEDK
jgi:hypothetical protein